MILEEFGLAVNGEILGGHGILDRYTLKKIKKNWKYCMFVPVQSNGNVSYTVI